MQYRRARQMGGTYFFTVVTYDRKPILTIPENIQRLREAFRHVMRKHPMDIEGIVILPDHLHCLWRLPERDNDFSIRWSKIKRYFSLSAAGVEQGQVSETRRRKREKAVWQRRFWEHLIRDEHDWRSHMDYIHYNPVKHGYVEAPGDWPYSSFSKSVKKGWYPQDWGRIKPDTIRGIELE